MDYLKNLKKRTKKGSKDMRDGSTTYVTTITTKRYEDGVVVEENSKTYNTDYPIDISGIELGKPSKQFDEDVKSSPVKSEKKLDQSDVKKSERPYDVDTVKKTEKPADPIRKPDPDEPVRDESIVSHKGERSDPASRCSPVVDADEFKDHLDLTDHDFSKVDAHAKNTPKTETESIERLSKYLTKPWNNDLDKLRCIFTWIAENISYDTDAFFGGNIQKHSPEEVLKTRKAVCDGYAEIFDKLASGLKVWKIKGHAKGVGFTAGCDINSRQFAHAWNGVLYKGEFLLIDSTWGAGSLNGPNYEKRFEPFYFLCSPTQFIYSHLPDDPEHQYIEPTLSKEEFLDLPYVKPQFFTSGLGFVKHLGNVIETSDDRYTMEIERVHPDESKPLHATLEWQDQEFPVLIQRLSAPGPKGGRKYKLSFTCPNKGEGKFNIFVMLKGNEGPLVSSLKVINSGSGKNHESFVNTYDVPFSYAIQSPIYSKLCYNEHTRFEITIFDMSGSELPSFALFLPDKSTIDLQKVSKTTDSYTFAIETRVDKKGKWNLTYCSKPNTFNFIAQYNVE